MCKGSYNLVEMSFFSKKKESKSGAWHGLWTPNDGFIQTNPNILGQNQQLKFMVFLAALSTKIWTVYVFVSGESTTSAWVYFNF